LRRPELARLLTHTLRNPKAIILNPAYTLMFQSKAFMKVLWDLYPNHPLLLETSFEPLKPKLKLRRKYLEERGQIPL